MAAGHHVRAAAEGLSCSVALFQCAANFSEGRRPDVMGAIVEAASEASDSVVADWSGDPDHNRMVLTLLGDAAAIASALTKAAEAAVSRIDMREHQGLHPRTGAVDVVPVTPLRGAERSAAVELARFIGTSLAGTLSLPIYFYEWAAQSPGRMLLPDLRRGGFEAYVVGPLAGSRSPDLGPDQAHPTAGIALVGARGPLVAYNVLLDAPDSRAAAAIARRIRTDRDRLPELAGVRALGLYLPRRGLAQISMNLTRPEETPLPAVFGYVEAQASGLGVEAVESEVIGLAPLTSLAGADPEDIRWRGFKPTQIIESWTIGASRAERGSGG